MDEICGLIEKEKPELVVIDSIQTMRCMDLSSSAGTVSQVKESAARLLAVAKKQEIPMFIVGHVNKDGAIAGPKVMEHIVDTVLYFEGDKMLPYRILRAAKNRYGSTNELGMFDMTGQGLEEIENPSQMLLEGRPLGVSGNCVACTMEGSRPILSEIQALATKTGRVFLWQSGCLYQHSGRHCPAGYCLRSGGMPVYGVVSAGLSRER